MQRLSGQKLPPPQRPVKYPPRLALSQSARKFFQRAEHGPGKGKEVCEAADDQGPCHPLPATKGAGQSRFGKVEDGEAEQVVEDEVTDEPASEFTGLEWFASTESQPPYRQNCHHDERANQREQ